MTPVLFPEGVAIPGGLGHEEVTIDYTFDPLNRLTAADYLDGTYFHYQYDAVGNRLQLDSSQDGVVTYQYDAANRLIEAGGVSYTWDNNGNLLSDGTSTYTYNYANRLAGVTQDGVAYSYAYNGMGDRLQQSVDGVATNYTLDINTDLTQVLADGTNTYLYGRSRIAQASSAGPEYFLGDALGSVHQVADPAAEAVLTRNYQPYGQELYSSGAAATPYGFTGEWTDQIGLIHLRARYYDPSQGRFLTKDPLIAGVNRYNYVESNPIMYNDPTGFFKNDVITNNLDLAGFQEVVDWFGRNTGTANGDFPRWGFLKLLQEAEYGNMIYGISLRNYGKIDRKYLGTFLHGIDDCPITIIDHGRVYTLEWFIQHLEAMEKEKRTEGVWSWRSYMHRYQLTSGNSFGNSFRDTHYSDLPDFYSIGLGGTVYSKLVFGLGAAVGVMFITDRYGNDYIGFSGEIGGGGGSFITGTYSEGYVGSKVSIFDGNVTGMHFNEGGLKNAIQGLNIGVNGTLGVFRLEGDVNVSSSLPLIMSASYGITLAEFNIGGGPSYAVEIFDIISTVGWSELDYIPDYNREDFNYGY